MTPDTNKLPTWNDIERAALFCHVLHHAVTRVRIGDCTREEALIIVALHLSKERAGFIQRETERLMRQPTAESPR